MVDLEYGRIVFAALDYRDSIDLRHTYFAVPLMAVSPHYMEGHILIRMPKLAFETADGFGNDDLPDMADRTWAERIYRLYG